MAKDTIVELDGKEVDESMVVTFSRPYIFEGQTYTEIDLSALDDFSTEQFELAEKQYTNTGNFSAIPEMTVGFSKYVASVVTKMPVEFFNGLPAKETVKIKNVCVGYFYS